LQSHRKGWGIARKRDRLPLPSPKLSETTA